MPTLAEIDKAYNAEQNRIKKRFKVGKLYSIEDLPVKPRRIGPFPKIDLEESKQEDLKSLSY